MQKSEIGQCMFYSLKEKLNRQIIINFWLQFVALLSQSDKFNWLVYYIMRIISGPVKLATLTNVAGVVKNWEIFDLN